MAAPPDDGSATVKDEILESPLDVDTTAPDCRPSMVEGAISPEAASRSSENFRKRYDVREDGEGKYLRCIEAPNIMVRIERGLVVSSGAARRAPEGTIYLDGAASGEPFMDVQRRVYNLDHHEGCVRSFTLATCEQAMVMVLKIVLTPAFSLLPLLVKDHFGGGAAQLSLLEAIVGGGIVAGGLLLSAWGGFAKKVYTI